jgi:hypothetical protein
VQNYRNYELSVLVELISYRKITGAISQKVLTGIKWNYFSTKNLMELVHGVVDRSTSFGL